MNEMLSTNFKSLLLCLVVSTIISGIFYCIINRQQKKIAVVDAVRLFNGFNMKIELERQASGKLNFYNKRIDSLEKQLKLAEYTPDSTGKRQLVRAYVTAKRDMEAQFSQSNQQINEMVWKRLNPLIDAYGKKNALHLVIGANGMGSVLYSDAYYDKTDEMIQYANKNYENEN